MTLPKTLLPAAFAASVLAALAVPVLAQANGSMTWSGRVDDTTVVTLHRGFVNSATISGKPATNERMHVYGSLPAAPEILTLQNEKGRGSVTIEQQPNRRNDYTAKIRIHDPQSGSGYYRFTATWQPRLAGMNGFRGHHRHFGN